MITLLLIALTILLPACDWFTQVKTIKGSGVTMRQERPIKNVDELSIEGSGLLILQQGDTESLVIETDDNLLPHIITEVDDEKLSIHPESQVTIWPESGLTYYLTLKKIKEIDIAGAVSCKSNLIKSDELALKFTGASKMQARIDVDKLEVKASGSVFIKLDGNAHQQKIEASGALYYDAKNVMSDSAEIEVSGTSRIIVSAAHKLDVEASGASVVQYKGDPEITKEITGTASIKKIE